jgi:hypothetical protein
MMREESLARVETGREHRPNSVLFVLFFEKFWETITSTSTSRVWLLLVVLGAVLALIKIIAALII